MSQFIAIYCHLLSFFNVNFVSNVSPDQPASSMIVRPTNLQWLKGILTFLLVIYHDGKISFGKTLERLFKAFCPLLCQDISECHDLRVGGRRAEGE